MKINPNSVVLRQVKNAKSLDRDFLMSESVRLNSPKILSLQKAQMRMGLDSGGNFFDPYVPWYAAYKATLNTYHAPIGVPDLYLSGEFQQEMDFIVDGDWAEFVSYVPYAQDVINKYPRLFGLSPDYLKIAKVTVTSFYNKQFYKQINK